MFSDRTTAFMIGVLIGAVIAAIFIVGFLMDGCSVISTV